MRPGSVVEHRNLGFYKSLGLCTALTTVHLKTVVESTHEVSPEDGIVNSRNVA